MRRDVPVRRTLAWARGAAWLLSPLTAAAQTSPTCRSLRDDGRDTVIVLEPPTTFTICRNGAPQDDVVTGRRVYFELAPTTASTMFDFRVHGQNSEWKPTGLGTWQEQAQRVEAGLRDLEESDESIASLVVPPEGAPAPPAALRGLAAARTRYLGVVTPRYLAVLQGVRGDLRDLPVMASVVRRWCAELAGRSPASLVAGVELPRRCAGPELHEGTVEAEVDALEAAAQRFGDARIRARDASVAATAHPEDSSAVSEGIRALDEARHAADVTIAATHPLRDTSRALARDLASLRVAIHSLSAVQAGVPTYLTTYGGAGNAELEIDANPVDIATVGASAEEKTAGKASFRFPVVDRHYFDLEAGVGITAGLPAIPGVVAQSNKLNLQGRPVDEFVGLALFELEPARFLWPDRPLAGLLRLPVIGVPFTRDPTQNFFIGAAVGWTGIGSITAGPYLLRELTLRDGYQLGQSLSPGTSLDAVTDPSLQVGYFVSASVDLLGVFHLFLPSRAPAIDAVTGKEK